MFSFKFLKLGNVSSVQAKRHQHIFQVLLDTSKNDSILYNILLKFNDGREWNAYHKLGHVEYRVVVSICFGAFPHRGCFVVADPNAANTQNVGPPSRLRVLKMIAGVVPLWYANELVLLQAPHDIRLPRLQLLLSGIPQVALLKLFGGGDAMLSIDYQEHPVLDLIPRLWLLLEKKPFFSTGSEANRLPLIDVTHLRKKLLQPLYNFHLTCTDYHCILIVPCILCNNHLIDVH